MPVYQYECHACATTFEELVASSEAPPPCPSCRGAADRVLSVITVGRSQAPARALQASFAKPSGASGGCGSCGNPAGPCALD